MKRRLCCCIHLIIIERQRFLLTIHHRADIQNISLGNRHICPSYHNTAILDLSNLYVRCIQFQVQSTEHEIDDAILLLDIIQRHHLATSPGSQITLGYIRCSRERISRTGIVSKLVISLNDIHTLMIGSDVQLILFPSLGIIIDMPEQHAMTWNEFIPALLLAVLHDEVFLIIGSSHRHHVCLVAVVQVRQDIEGIYPILQHGQVNPPQTGTLIGRE